MDLEGAEVITLSITLRWAMLPPSVQRGTWARRLGQVRGFAAWRSAFDPRTEVPPHGALSARRQRNPPHIYSEEEVQALMAGAVRLPKGKIRPWTFRTLLALMASTGLRPPSGSCSRSPRNDCARRPPGSRCRTSHRPSWVSSFATWRSAAEMEFALETAACPLSAPFSVS